MASLLTALKPPSPYSPYVEKHYTSGNNNCNALFTYHKPNSTNIFSFKERGSVARKKSTLMAVHDAPDQIESSRKIPFSEVAVVSKKRAFWERSRNSWEVSKFFIIVGLHLLSLLAPFYFTWAAFRLFLGLIVINGICITLSYHRNLAHRSFDLPKWLEYLFAYGGLMAIQGDPIEWASIHRYHHKHCDTQLDPHSPTQGFWFSHITWIFHTLEKCGGEENANDLVRQPFYRFLQRTIVLHLMAFAFVLYFCGGMLFLVWGFGVANMVRLHGTFMVNSVSHIWGTRAWNTSDFSKNNWDGITIIMRSSSQLGMALLDVTWYIIRFLEAIGLATNVKLPSEAQKKKMALA